MGVFDKAKGLLSAPLADEPVRAVDNQRARLPTWEPEQPEEKQNSSEKATPKKTKSTSSKTKKKTKTAPSTSKPKAPPRAIANFSTWSDEDDVGAPRSVRVTPERKASMTESELSALEEDLDTTDEDLQEETHSEETPALESLEAWDPYAAEDDDELDEVMNSSQEPIPTETPQSTDDEPALTDYALPDETPHVENDETETMSAEMNVTPEDVDIPQVPEVTLDELPQREATESTEEIIARFTAGETLDLKRAISLEALDNLAIPEESNGYNRANVDAMMSFLRLSLDLYSRRVKQLESLTGDLAEEHSTLTKEYAQLREVSEAMIPVEVFAREREAREDLETAVMELSSAAGVDSSKYLAPKEEEFVLTFSPKEQKRVETSVDSRVNEESDAETDSFSNTLEAPDDSEDLLWGGRLR